LAHGVLGVPAARLTFVLPSFLTIVVLSALQAAFGELW
jgi:chromate transport protein ChrA